MFYLSLEPIGLHSILGKGRPDGRAFYFPGGHVGNRGYIRSRADSRTCADNKALSRGGANIDLSGTLWRTLCELLQICSIINIACAKFRWSGIQQQPCMTSQMCNNNNYESWKSSGSSANRWTEWFLHCSQT